MHRFYLPPEPCQGHPPYLELTGGEAHHARDVLRLARGDEVTVLTGLGERYACQIHELDRHRVILAVTHIGVTPPPTSRITLIQAVPKGKLFESIIQKAVELGVARVVPLLSERVILRLDGAEDALAKAEKWRQTAIEAIKQCGQTWLPEITLPLTLSQLLAQRDAPDLALVGSLEGDGRHPRTYFQEFEARHHRRPQSVTAWIGPEGDFTAGELAQIRHSGAQPISLGPLVLRSDTAALYTVAVIAYELQAGLPESGSP